MITQDQENEQHLLQKYKNVRLFDDDDNQTYMIVPENLEFTTRRNKQYCVFGQPLDCRDGDNLDLLISREINDNFMVLIKGVEQDPYLGVTFFHLSIHDDSEATESEIEENNDKNSSKIPYDDENINTSSYDEGNNDEDAPDTPYYGENINAYSNNE